jgi:hypothetical protein
VKRAAFLLLLASCYPTHPEPTHLPSIEGRIRDAGSLWDRYSAADKENIKNGIVRPGLDELALYIAKGRPAFTWKTQLSTGNCTVLLHSAKTDADEIDTAAYACNGTLEAVVPVDPKLPCWRLASVAPRIQEKRVYFDGKPLPSQWEIVEGILKRGMSGDDIYIAFGKPYNTGVEAREDGTNATTRVFLDSTNESYGLYVTLLNDKVAGWKIPADRQLTPEAQQKRLEASEQRLMQQLKVMEAKADLRHKEEMKLLNQLQSSGDEVVKKQTSGLTLAAIFSGTGAGGIVGTVDKALDTTKKVAEVVDKVSERISDKPTEEKKDDASTPPPPQEKTATIGKCTFHESSGDLGKPCGKGKACKKGYACYGVTKGRGQCAPIEQINACKRGQTSGY